jgi:hypothetical protein
MFTEHKEVGEGQQVTKLSQAIRRGHSMIAENRECYLITGEGCALGALWVGMGRTEREWQTLRDREHCGFALFARELGIPRSLASEISSRHYLGASRLEIADWLETQGL